MKLINALLNITMENLITKDVQMMNGVEIWVKYP